MSDDLIARLEKATGPDREIDALIGAACKIVDDFDPLWFTVPAFYVGDDRGNIRIYAGKVDPSVAHHKYTRRARPFTASVDAALTLKPDGFQAYVDTGLGPGQSHACVWIDHPHRIQGGARQMATPAIALCVAALKARSTLKTAQDRETIEK